MYACVGHALRENYLGAVPSAESGAAPLFGFTAAHCLALLRKDGYHEQMF